MTEAGMNKNKGKRSSRGPDQLEVVEWYACYSEEATQEYFYYPGTRIVTWTLPDNAHPLGTPQGNRKHEGKAKEASFEQTHDKKTQAEPPKQRDIPILADEQGVPTHSIPAREIPSNNIQSREIPINTFPTNETSINEKSAGDSPDRASDEETPVHKSLDHNIPTQEAQVISSREIPIQGIMDQKMHARTGKKAGGRSKRLLTVVSFSLSMIATGVVMELDRGSISGVFTALFDSSRSVGTAGVARTELPGTKQALTVEKASRVFTIKDASSPKKTEFRPIVKLPASEEKSLMESFNLFSLGKEVTPTLEAKTKTLPLQETISVDRPQPGLFGRMRNYEDMGPSKDKSTLSSDGTESSPIEKGAGSIKGRRSLPTESKPKTRASPKEKSPGSIRGRRAELKESSPEEAKSQPKPIQKESVANKGRKSASKESKPPTKKHHPKEKDAGVKGQRKISSEESKPEKNKSQAKNQSPKNKDTGAKKEQQSIKESKPKDAMNNAKLSQRVPDKAMDKPQTQPTSTGLGDDVPGKSSMTASRADTASTAVEVQATPVDRKCLVPLAHVFSKKCRHAMSSQKVFDAHKLIDSMMQ